MNSNIMLRQLFFLIVMTFSNSVGLFGQVRNEIPTANSDSIAVLKRTNEFVVAFTNLDWDKFTEFFADDATAFFPPSAKYPYRANNKKEIEKLFKLVFENAHKQKSTSPYLDIEPKDLKIQLSSTVAIVTFILNDPYLLGRRTLIWTKHNNKWKIIHLHASGNPIPK